ncbi:MAG TPA: hypothetical protein VMF67_04770 [Rhizomicrobium sp.]|nr:hypothetical protein [Rhizomicrobium sp.]
MFTHSGLNRSPASRLRHLLAGLALACAASAYAMPAGAQQNPHDLYNEFDLPVLDPQTNTYGPDGIEIDFSGNVCPNIPAQYIWDAGIDPFYALAEYEASINGPVVTPSFTCTYDSNTNITHALWSGGTIPVPLPASGWPIPLHTDPSGNRYLHSGLDRGAATLIGIIPIYKSWIWTQTGQTQSMIIPITAALASRLGVEKKPQYAALFLATGATSTSAPTGTWYMLGYEKTGKPQFTLTNNGPDTITFPTGGSGIVTGIAPPAAQQCDVTPNCYDTVLDTLNDQGYPEPGEENSPFTPIKLPSQLSPGQTYTFIAP